MCTHTTNHNNVDLVFKGFKIPLSFTSYIRGAGSQPGQSTKLLSHRAELMNRWSSRLVLLPAAVTIILSTLCSGAMDRELTVKVCSK